MKGETVSRRRTDPQMVAARGMFWGRSDPDEPACHTWPVPGNIALISESSHAARAVLLEWQCGRCAICGRHQHETRLVCDHDHETGLIRGWLCHSDNTREPLTEGGAFALYRAQNPASMLGIRVLYRAARPRTVRKGIAA